MGERSGLTAVRPDDRPLSTLWEMELEAGRWGTWFGAVSIARIGRDAWDICGMRETRGDDRWLRGTLWGGI